MAAASTTTSRDDETAAASASTGWPSHTDAASGPLCAPTYPTTKCAPGAVVSTRSTGWSVGARGKTRRLIGSGTPVPSWGCHTLAVGSKSGSSTRLRAGEPPKRLRSTNRRGGGTSTGPGVLDIFDFLCFQNRYDQGVPYACDCDTTTGPGVCDIFDFLCFQNAYDQGCP